MQELTLPELDKMSDHELRDWVATLSKEAVFANLKTLHQIVTKRFGTAARLIVATHHPPRIIEIVDEQIA